MAVRLDPEALNFGVIALDDLEEPPTEVVALHNDGAGPLEIRDMYIDDSAAPYELGYLSSPLLQPGGTATFSVTFRPESPGLAEAIVIIESNDPDEEAIELPLRGEGVAPF